MTLISVTIPTPPATIPNRSLTQAAFNTATVDWLTFEGNTATAYSTLKTQVNTLAGEINTLYTDFSAKYGGAYVDDTAANTGMTEATGSMYYNSTINRPKFYNGAAWTDPVGDAITAAATAAASYDAFDDRSLGAKASDPSLDNDGNALLEGAIYWNTVSKKFRVWNGTTWQDAVTGGLTVQEADGTPSIVNISLLKVTNGTLTDEGGGVVSLTIGGGGSLPTTIVADTSIIIDGSSTGLTFNGVLADTVNSTAPLASANVTWTSVDNGEYFITADHTDADTNVAIQPVARIALSAGGAVGSGTTTTSINMTNVIGVTGDMLLTNGGANGAYVVSQILSTSGGSSYVSNANPFGDGSGKMLWQCDDNAATTTVTDTNATYSGTASANTNTITTTGKYSSAFTFNGSSTKVTNASVPFSSSYSKIFTATMWIKTANGYTTVCVPTTTGGTGSSYMGLELNVTAGKLRTISNNNANFVYSNVIVNDGLWHFVAWGSDGTNLFISVDGETKLTASAGTFSISDGFIIGGRYVSATDSWFTGQIDQVRVFNKMLSNAEIATLYIEQSALIATIAALAQTPTRFFRMPTILMQSRIGASDSIADFANHIIDNITEVGTSKVLDITYNQIIKSGNHNRVKVIVSGLNSGETAALSYLERRLWK